MNCMHTFCGKLREMDIYYQLPDILRRISRTALEAAPVIIAVRKHGIHSVNELLKVISAAQS